MIDLDAYLARIGYDGPRAATIDTLKALCQAHARSIPFENIDPLLGAAVELDIDAIQQKLVHGGRGGFCFEQNTLFQHALEALDFDITPLAGRVLWGMSDDIVRPRSHMILRVHFPDADRIVDMGFGGMTLTSPLKLFEEAPQETPHQPFRLRRDGEDFIQEVLLDRAWRPVYRFDLQRQYPRDYDVVCWYITHHPQSHFLHQLICARSTPEKRYALSNNMLTVYPVAGGKQQRLLDSPAALKHVLESDFGLKLPTGPDMAALLERLTAAP